MTRMTRPGFNAGTYYSMPKGTSWAKAMSNGEKIKLVALAVIELCLSEGISQLLSQ